jgi:hypothetical protein
MRRASQIWQVFFLRKPFTFFVFLSQNLQIFGLALRKKAQYVVVNMVDVISMEQTKYLIR